MTHTIIVNDHEFAAFNWREVPASPPGEEAEGRHARNPQLFEAGVAEPAPGEVFFRCDQRIVFDTTFSLKGDGRKFVIISSRAGEHVAKPY